MTIDHDQIHHIADLAAPIYQANNWQWARDGHHTDLAVPDAAQIADSIREVVTELAGRGRDRDSSIGTGRLAFFRSSDEEGVEVGVYLHLGSIEFPAAHTDGTTT